MERTAHRVLVAGGVVVLLGLMVGAGVAGPVVSGEAQASPRHAGSPAVSAEPSPGPLAAREAGVIARSGIELILLAAVCGAALAFYSAGSGDPARPRATARRRR